MGQSSCIESATSCLPKNDTLTIWGDHFNQDTRALLIMCEMADVRHKFREVNTFKEENLSEKYKQVNPTATIPIITCKNTKCLGDQLSLYEFLYNTDLGMRVMFYNDEQVLAIKNIMSWF